MNKNRINHLLRRWIENNADNKSLRNHALKADIDPSTIQKFMRPNCKHTLSFVVIAKLAKEFGEWPDVEKL